MSDWADEKAEDAVAKIFEDLRDRRFLKWLFKEDADAEHCIQRDGPVYALDKDVQDDIAATWAGICATALREAEAKGRRAGIEEAARWHDQKWSELHERLKRWGDECQERQVEMKPHLSFEIQARITAHDDSATALRALPEKEEGE